jgi:site-specific DNA recombinase
VAFYVRVSTDRQAQVVEGSLKNQEQMLASELRRRNTSKKWGRLVGSYVDGGFSAKNTDRPEFQRLMADIEHGVVDAVFFTELSRLSRSLRDFIHIFEFTQEHGCDLVCLKTEIDTTSPFSNLVVRILMVFSEFEREITADRIKRNAYERSKRGLAYGGFELLGYKRDPEHKGRLVIHSEETKIVRDIFSTYIRRRSLLGATQILKKKYDHPRIQKLSRNGIYGILTNKAYIGIREIKTADGIEEVSGAWKPIIDKQIFLNVSDILKTNGPGPRSPRFNYLFSGLIRCAKCGKKLQGKSGAGRSGEIRYYYAHGSRCSEGGHNSIVAEDAHKLVLDWLTSILHRERFNELIGQGRNALEKQIRVLSRELKQLDYEDAALRKRLADCTAKMANAASADLQERENEQLLEEIQKNERASGQNKRETETLTDILNIKDQAHFESYAERVRRFNSLSFREKNRRISALFRFVTLDELSLKVELIHSGKPDSPGLISDAIRLPGILLLKSKAYLRRLHHQEKLSARMIGQKIKAAPSTVSDALHKHGLASEMKKQLTRPHQVPFGFDLQNGKLVINRNEQKTIRMIRQLRATGLSLRDIAAHLNRKLIATKRGGVWAHSTLHYVLRQKQPKQD